MTRRAALALLLWMLAGCPSEPVVGPPRVSADPKPVCRLRRAAFDIGSATTKVKVADIDICAHRILRVLLAEDAAVFYRDDVIDKPDDQAVFREETLAQGLEVLGRFKQKAEALDPAGYAAVATSSFRKAQNGEAFLTRVDRELGIRARIISQAEEAELGFLGAVASLGVDPTHAVVWDIGGQSMQIAVLGATIHQMRIYTGRFSSGHMRQYLMREVQKKDDSAKTPNPIKEQEAQAARSYAADFARSDVPEWTKRKLAQPGLVVVGIGALKYFPDARPDGRALASLAGLEKSAMDMLGKSDSEIGGPYASTHVSDRLLILGFMDALGIREVRLADVDLGDGLLFHEDYWEE